MSERACEQRRDVALYYQLGQWLYEQGEWVSARSLARQFGLSAQQCRGCMTALQKRCGDNYQERQEHEGRRMRVYVRITDWEYTPVFIKPVNTPWRGIRFVAGELAPPIPSYSQHPWWLQLTQHAWQEMRFEQRPGDTPLIETDMDKSVAIRPPTSPVT